MYKSNLINVETASVSKENKKTQEEKAIIELFKLSNEELIKISIDCLSAYNQNFVDKEIEKNSLAFFRAVEETKDNLNFKTRETITSRFLELIKLPIVEIIKMIQTNYVKKFKNEKISEENVLRHSLVYYAYKNSRLEMIAYYFHISNFLSPLDSKSKLIMC